jgi:hypothetical protein
MELDIKNIIIGLLGLISTINEILPFIEAVEANGLIHYIWLQGQKQKLVDIEEQPLLLEYEEENEVQLEPTHTNNKHKGQDNKVIETQEVSEVQLQEPIETQVSETQTDVSEIQVSETQTDVSEEQINLGKFVSEYHKIEPNNHFMNKITNKINKNEVGIQDIYSKINFEFENKFKKVDDNFNIIETDLNKMDKNYITIKNKCSELEEKLSKLEDKFSVTISTGISVLQHKTEANKYDIDNIKDALEYFNSKLV